jgi:hypothetical protein
MQKTTMIEGYTGYEHQEDLLDDTNPGSVIVKFLVKSEVMPALSASAGREVRKNFVHVEVVMELGRSSWCRRVRDTVEFDEQTNKWKVTKLAEGERSDIRRWPDAWNAFARNSSEDVTGTPLSLLFKNDPSRVEHYKTRQITTVERLASMNSTDIDNLGMGARGDHAKAVQYLTRVKMLAGANEANFEIEKIANENESLRNQVADLSSKLTQLLEAQLGEAPKKRGRPAKSDSVEASI